MLQVAQHLLTVEGIKTSWNNISLTNLRKSIIKIKCILFQWNILIKLFDNSSVFLLSVTGQIASVSFEGNGASAGDTELYCKVSLHFNENQIKTLFTLHLRLYPISLCFLIFIALFRSWPRLVYYCRSRGRYNSGNSIHYSIIAAI